MAEGMGMKCCANTRGALLPSVLSVKPLAVGLEWFGEMEQRVTPALMNTQPVELVCQTTKTWDGAGGQQGKGLRSGTGP